MVSFKYTQFESSLSKHKRELNKHSSPLQNEPLGQSEFCTHFILSFPKKKKKKINLILNF